MRMPTAVPNRSVPPLSDNRYKERQNFESCAPISMVSNALQLLSNSRSENAYTKISFFWDYWPHNCLDAICKCERASFISERRRSCQPFRGRSIMHSVCRKMCLTIQAIYHPLSAQGEFDSDFTWSWRPSPQSSPGHNINVGRRLSARR